MKVKRRNLLFICPSYPAVGGVETVTSILVDFFLDNAFNISILVPNIAVKSGGILDKHFSLMYSMSGKPNSSENLEEIDKFISDNKIDCVFNQGIFSDSSLSLNKNNNTIYINTLHSCPFWEVEKFSQSSIWQLFVSEKRSFGKIKLLARYLLNKYKPGLSHPNINKYYSDRIESADYYVVLNRLYKSLLEQTLYNGVEHNNIVAIPNPLIIPQFDEIKKSNTVLYVGRLDRIPKRVDRLLRIWKTIQTEIPDWKLDIIGEGEDKIKLEKYSSELCLERVRFFGKISASEHYPIASILCLTSTYEGYPMVISEAQSFGTIPVVFNCSPAFPDMINNHIDGILVKNGDESSFAYELLYLIKNESLRNEMMKNAIEKSKSLDINIIGKTWLSLINKDTN